MLMSPTTYASAFEKSDNENRHQCLINLDDNAVISPPFLWTYYVYPWRCKAMKAVLRLINSKVKSILREQLKKHYDAEKHYFQLTMNTLCDHCKLIKESKISCSFSKNLAHLLGFPIKETCKHLQHVRLIY